MKGKKKILGIKIVKGYSVRIKFALLLIFWANSKGREKVGSNGAWMCSLNSLKMTIPPANDNKQTIIIKETNNKEIIIL